MHTRALATIGYSEAGGLKREVYEAVEETRWSALVQAPPPPRRPPVRPPFLAPSDGASNLGARHARSAAL